MARTTEATTDSRRVSLGELLREAWTLHDRDPFAPGFHVLALHHAKRWARTLPLAIGVPIRAVLFGLSTVAKNVYGIEIPSTVVLGRRTRIPHQGGIVIHKHVVIGDDCLIRHNVTLGASGRVPFDLDHPTIGDDVHFGVGAVVMGPVTIGDGARIGPNAVIMTNVPAGAVVSAPASRVIAPRAADEPRRDA